MGIDCSAIAKMKNGTYRYRHFDREYVFANELNKHESLTCDVWIKDFKYVKKWCYDRLTALRTLSEIEAKENQTNIDYELCWINDFLDFLNKIFFDDYEEVGIFNDTCSDIYDNIICYGKENGLIVDKI